MRVPVVDRTVTVPLDPFVVQHAPLGVGTVVAAAVLAGAILLVTEDG